MASTAVLSPGIIPYHRRSPSPTASAAHRLSTQSTVSSSAASFQTAPMTTPSSTHTITSPIQHAPQEIHILTVTEETIKLDKRPATTDSYITRVVTGPLPPSPPASITQDDDHDKTITAEPEALPQPPQSILQAHSTPSPQMTSLSPQRLQRSTTDSGRPGTADSSPNQLSYLPTPPPSSFTKAAAHLSSDGHLQPPPPFSYRERPARRNTTGSAPKRPIIQTTGELEDDIQLHAEHIRQERLSRRLKLQAEAEAEAALTRTHEVPLVGNLIGEGHVNYVLMYNMLTGIRIGVSRCQAKIKRPLTPEDFKARHKFSFDVIGNELTPSAKYDFKFKDYAPWVFRSLREDFFHLDPADYLLSLTSKYILSELGSPGKSGSFFYFSRDYRFIIKTIHHSEHAYLLKILPKYYAHVQNNPHTLISRFYGLHRVKLPRGRKIHFVIMNNIFPPHRDIHETYDLKGSTVGREFPEEKAKDNPRAVLKDLNWLNRGRMLELGPEKRALFTEQLRRDSEFLKTVNVMDYSLLVGIHNMQRGNRDNVRRNTLKVFSPLLPDAPHRKKGMGHSHKLSSHTQGSPQAIAMRRALYRTSGVNDVQLPDADDPAVSEPGELPAPPTSAVPSNASLQPNQPSLQVQMTPNASTSSYNPHPHRTLRENRGKDKEKELAEHFIDRQHFVFYQDEGGMRATDEGNEDMNTIYYVGVIDILTPWRGLKKLERFWKGLSADRHKISPVPPGEYADRFLAFLKAIMRGGEGGARFKAE